jgi:hypothetical protein
MRTLSWAALVCLVVACSGSNDNTALPPAPIDMGQGGTGGSDGTDTDASADTGLVPCGAMSCGAGEYCCDGTCGACIAVGLNCPLDPCGTDAAAPAAE